MNTPGIKALTEAIEREIDAGVNACQFAFARAGKIIWKDSFGECDDQTAFCAYSSTKAIIAAAIWILIDREAISPKQSVAHYISPFRNNGLEAIQVWHLLTHTAGIPNAPIVTEQAADRKSRIKQFGHWTLDYKPGTLFRYHISSAHWVLAELIETVSKMDFRDFVADELTRPLDLPRVIGISNAQQHRIADLTPVGPFSRDINNPELSLHTNNSDWRLAGSPANGAFISASDLALLYQATGHNQNRLWSEKTLAEGTAVLHCTLTDPHINGPANRTLGLTLCGNDGHRLRRGFGLTNSKLAYGHAGAHGQIAWMDPRTGISFVCLNNALESDLARTHRRAIRLSNLGAAAASHF